MTIVFKPSDNVKEMIIKYYSKYEPLYHPQYTVFQAKLYDCVVTLYESGKIMFQGLGADIEVIPWLEQEKKLNNRSIDITGKEKSDKKKDEDKKFYYTSTIGSDEVGTGDYFGPIIVAATYVSKENIKLLDDLGVRDSKKISDDKIIEIAPKIMKNIPYFAYSLDNLEYNNLSEENQNMNKIKAILHNKALISLLKKDNYDYKMIVIDQFCYPKNFYGYISNAKEKITKVTFMTKAEDQVISVAAASIICRYLFLKKMDEMSKELGITIPKGAGENVDTVAKDLLNKLGEEKLKKYVKYNFKNTKKIKEL